MKNEEMKKKIVEILKEAMKPIEYGGDREHAPEVHYPTEEEIADALIAAGIGDVKEAELERKAYEVAEKALDLCETAYILSLNHRATEGISGQAIASDLGVHKFFIEQAEKELAEEGK